MLKGGKVFSKLIPTNETGREVKAVCGQGISPRDRHGIDFVIT